VPFEHIPLVDNHAHPSLRVPAEPFARFFTEGPQPRPDTLFFRQALRALAELLGCPPDETSVLAARRDAGFMRRLVDDARIETVLLDDGYPREGGYTVHEMAQLGGFSARRVLRIERLAEDLIPDNRELDELIATFVARLDAARPVLAALKSVIAYRSGLRIEPPNRDQAAAGLAAHTGGRLMSKPLLELLLHVAADWASANGVPLHLHTGFGDRDLDLRLANPLHLRPLLENDVLGRGPLVLLHASYPYSREAAYLATMYPEVYIDLSLVSPLLAGPALTRVLEDLLGQAPVTRLLYGSDAWGIPDWLWLAARATRHALGEALIGLPSDEGEWVARRVLHDNAAELYGLPGG
jgi:uncharacterized protein